MIWTIVYGNLGLENRFPSLLASERSRASSRSTLFDHMLEHLRKNPEYVLSTTYKTHSRCTHSIFLIFPPKHDVYSRKLKLTINPIGWIIIKKEKTNFKPSIFYSLKTNITCHSSCDAYASYKYSHSYATIRYVVAQRFVAILTAPLEPSAGRWAAMVQTLHRGRCASEACIWRRTLAEIWSEGRALKNKQGSRYVCIHSYVFHDWLSIYIETRHVHSARP